MEKEEDSNSAHSSSDQELKLQLLQSTNEARIWKERCTAITIEKASQLRKIETNLMLLEAKLIRERKEIEKQLSKQNRLIKEQKNKIEKLTTANQKLLAGLMLLRYEKPNKFPMDNGPITGRGNFTADMSQDAQSNDNRTPTQIKSKALIASRAREVANQIAIEKSLSTASNQTAASTITAKKGRAHRSHSLPYAQLDEDLSKRLRSLERKAEPNEGKHLTQEFTDHRDTKPIQCNNAGNLIKQIAAKSVRKATEGRKFIPTDYQQSSPGRNPQFGDSHYVQDSDSVQDHRRRGRQRSNSVCLESEKSRYTLRQRISDLRISDFSKSLGHESSIIPHTKEPLLMQESKYPAMDEEPERIDNVIAKAKQKRMLRRRSQSEQCMVIYQDHETSRKPVEAISVSKQGIDSSQYKKIQSQQTTDATEAQLNKYREELLLKKKAMQYINKDITQENFEEIQKRARQKRSHSLPYGGYKVTL